MRKYGGLILISSLLLASCNSPAPVEPESKPVLQLAAGTFSGLANEQPGTSLLVKLTMPDGSAVTEDAQITITGPKGWNEDKPRMLKVYAGDYINWLLAGAAPPMNGVYKASVDISGQTYTATSGQIDVTRVLGAAEPITAIDDGTRVTVTWPPVSGASLYLQRLYTPDPNAPGAEILVNEASFYTRNVSTTFPSSVLTSGSSYDIAVLAFNAEVDKEEALNVPTQFNASRTSNSQPFFRNP